MCSRSGNDVNELAVAEQLAQVAGIDAIKSLVIEPTSSVRNLLFLRALPELESLQLNGLRLRSLDGLEWFQRGRFIKIDTGKKRLDVSSISP